MMAGLVQGSAFVFCGGTILSNNHVLTSAHCVVGKSPTSLQVLVGDWDYKSNTDTPYAALYGVRSCLNHPSFNPNSNANANDIAILYTQKSITFNVAVGPVCLPSTNSFTDSSVEAVGWGSTGYGSPVSTILKKVSLVVISNTVCNNYYHNIQASQICTYASGRDSCQYDSGGPIYITLNGLVYLAGVITAGSGCASSYPSINTRVSSYVSWIRSNAPGSF